MSQQKLYFTTIPTVWLFQKATTKTSHKPLIVFKWTHSLLTQPHSAVFLFGVNHLGPNEGGDSSPKGDLRLKQWFTALEQKGVKLEVRRICWISTSPNVTKLTKAALPTSPSGNWCTPLLGQCKHSHSVRVVSRYHHALANTQMEDSRTPPLTRCHPLLSLLLQLS